MKVKSHANARKLQKAISTAQSSAVAKPREALLDFPQEEPHGAAWRMPAAPWLPAQAAVSQPPLVAWLKGTDGFPVAEADSAPAHFPPP